MKAGSRLASGGFIAGTSETVNMSFKEAYEIMDSASGLTVDKEQYRYGGPNTSGKLDLNPLKKNKDGSFTYKAGHFYTFGKTYMDTYASIRTAFENRGFNTKFLNGRDVDRTWPKSSYWEVNFEVTR